MSRLTASRAASTAAAEAKNARDVLVPHLVTARDAVGPALGHAREAVLPALGHARETVLPALEHARRAVEDTLKDDLMPRVAAGIAATEPARDEALRRGTAAIAALRGQVEPPASHKGRRAIGIVLIVAAGAAAGTAAWRAWKLPHDSDDWVHTDSFTSGAVPGTDAGASEDAPKAAEEPPATNGQRPAVAGTRRR